MRTLQCTYYTIVLHLSRSIFLGTLINDIVLVTLIRYSKKVSVRNRVIRCSSVNKFHYKSIIKNYLVILNTVHWFCHIRSGSRRKCNLDTQMCCGNCFPFLRPVSTFTCRRSLPVKKLFIIPKNNFSVHSSDNPQVKKVFKSFN